jgi:hypothetical protein
MQNKESMENLVHYTYVITVTGKVKYINVLQS